MKTITTQKDDRELKMPAWMASWIQRQKRGLYIATGPALPWIVGDAGFIAATLNKVGGSQ